jgi:hypothetical protein
MERNDWDTACGNFKTSISSIYHHTNSACSFSLQFLFFTDSLLFAPLLFDSDIYRQQITTFSILAGVGICEPLIADLLFAVVETN